MKAEEFHKAMRPVNEACLLAKSGWVCLSNPLVGWGEEGMIRWKLGILLRHIALVFRCLEKVAAPHILVREFSSVPLLLVFSFLWPMRKKLLFMLHQNIQWAAQRKSEHLALVALSKMGARWAVLETQDFQGLEKFNIPSDQNLVLSHPVQKSPPAEGCPKGGVGSFLHSPPREGCPKGGVGSPVIGVVGYYRPEKGMDELVETLKKMNGGRDTRLPTFGILLGVPNPEAVRHLDVEVVDTSTEEAYRELISQCDVLVFNQRSDGYFYRASGPIADAAACGTAVVAPDFPMLGKQVAGIGEVFQSLEKMPEAVRRAIEKMRNGEYDFETYCAARSAQAIAKLLDDFNIEKSKEAKKELATI